MGEILKKIKANKHKEVIAFSIIMFILYLLTLSCSFDDEDSILFVLGVKEFNVAEYQPHPPGYPVYIFLGKIFSFFLKEEFLALTILSAVFGALSLIVFYFLIFEMFNKKIALMSTLIMGVTPLFWLNSVKALSDMPGFFFILLSMYFIYGFIKYKKTNLLYIASFISAIAVGVRVHALFAVVPLLIYSYFKTSKKLNRHRYSSSKRGFFDIGNRRKIFYSLVLFLIGILVWFVPMILVNGFENYIDTVFGHSLSIVDNSGISTLAGLFKEPSFGYLFSRVTSFFNFFLAEGYGINLWAFNISYVIALVFFLFFLFLSYEKLKDERIIFFIIGLAFYSIMTFLFLPPHNPRYFLPLLSFISLLFSFGILWFGKFDYLAFIFLLFLLLIHTVPLAKEIHEVPSAPVQLVEYIKTNYNLSEVAILRDHMTVVHLDYYNLNSSTLAVLETGRFNRSVLGVNIFNRSLGGLRFNRLREEVVDKNKTLLIVNPTYNITQSYNATLIKVFERDLRIHPKHNIVFLYEIKKEYLFL